MWISVITDLVTGITVALVMILYYNINQQREHRNKRSENLKIFYNTEYLSKEIKDARFRLTVNKYLDQEEKEVDLNTIAIALQRIGIMIYIGGIDLSFAILMNGFQILTDWMLVKEYVETVLQRNERFFSSIPCERRHGEWLSLIIYMHLCRGAFASLTEKKRILDKFEEMYSNKQAIADREKMIFNLDKMFVHPCTRRIVNSIRKRFKSIGCI